MRFDFTGQRAVVTGGANGIGLAAARLLAECGARVCVLDLAVERPEETAAVFGAEGRAVDITDRAALEAALDADIVVANAGIAPFGAIADLDPAAWQRTLAVNLTGTFNTVQLAARKMKPRRRGSIVVTASTNSFDGENDLGAYNATKAGLLGLVRTAANELGPLGVRVNAVCPGLIRTRLNDAWFHQTGSIREYLRDIPLGRAGTTDDVARAIAFLASDAASFITGTTLVVDGGQMAAKFGTWKEDAAHFETDHWVLD